MKELIAKITAKFAELRQQANDALAKMKPLEQQEGAEAIGYLFRSARNIVECLTEYSTALETKIKDGMAELQEAARAELRADETFRQEVAKDAKIIEAIKGQLIQSGELLTKTDHDGKIQAAKDAEGRAVKERLEQETKASQLIVTRRGEAATALQEKLKPLGDKAAATATEMATKLKDEELAKDGYKTLIATAAERAEKCVKLGINKTETLQEVAAMEGATFDSLHAGWEQVHQSGGKGAPFATASSKPGATAPAEDEKKPARIMV